uniref:Uncharacterized protein n=1 Tax=Zooxanthella nutricula TaxID=1333877 RepID=A0A7S2J5Z5_9DINO
MADFGEINTSSYGGLFSKPLYVHPRFRRRSYLVYFLLGALPLCYVAHGVYVLAMDSSEPPTKETHELRTSSTWQDVVLCPYIWDNVGAKLIRAELYSQWSDYPKLNKSQRVQCEAVPANMHAGYLPKNIQCVKFDTQGLMAKFESDDVAANNEAKMGIPQIYFRAVWESQEKHSYDFGVGAWVGDGIIGTVNGYQEARHDFGVMTQFDLSPKVLKQSDFWCHKSATRHGNCTLGDGFSLSRAMFGEEKYSLGRSKNMGLDILLMQRGHWAFRGDSTNYSEAGNFACSKDLSGPVDRSSVTAYEVQVMMQLFSTSYTIHEIVALHWRIMDFLSNGFAFTCMLLGSFTLLYSQYPPPKVPEHQMLRPLWSQVDERLERMPSVPRFAQAGVESDDDDDTYDESETKRSKESVP